MVSCDPSVKSQVIDKASQMSFAPVKNEVGYLNVCVHCGECLKTLVQYPNKLNVVVFYRNERGDFIEWKPLLPTKESHE